MIKFGPLQGALTKVYTFSRKHGKGSCVARIHREILQNDFRQKQKKKQFQIWSSGFGCVLIITPFLPVLFLKRVWIPLILIIVSTFTILVFKNHKKQPRKSPSKSPRKKRSGNHSTRSRRRPAQKEGTYSRSQGHTTPCKSQELRHTSRSRLSSCAQTPSGSEYSSLHSTPLPSRESSYTHSYAVSPVAYGNDTLHFVKEGECSTNTPRQPEGPINGLVSSPMGVAFTSPAQSATVYERFFPNPSDNKAGQSKVLPSPAIESGAKVDSQASPPEPIERERGTSSSMLSYPGLMERHNLSLYCAKVQVLNHRIMPGSYVNYCIRVSLRNREGYEWDIWHRYSEVMTLHLAVKKELQVPRRRRSAGGTIRVEKNATTAVLLPRSPPRSFRRSITDAVISQRMQVIGELLAALVNQRELCDLAPVREFLGVLPLPASLQSRLASPVAQQKEEPKTAEKRDSVVRFLDDIITQTNSFLSPLSHSSQASSVADPQSPPQSNAIEPTLKSSTDPSYKRLRKKLSLEFIDTSMPPKKPQGQGTASNTVTPDEARKGHLENWLKVLSSTPKQDTEPVTKEEVFNDINPEIFDSFLDSSALQNFKIRGGTYLEDKMKVPAKPALFELLHADIFEVPREIGRIDHIAASEMGQKHLNRVLTFYHYDFVFIINYQIPGNPLLNMVTYHGVSSSFLERDSTDIYVARAQKLFRRFLQLPDSDPKDPGKIGLEEFQNLRFKLVPSIVDGPWVCRKAVVNKPAILGQKITQRYFKAENYIEIDLDIASSIVADKIVSLCRGYAVNLVVDVGITIEGQTPEELPEMILTSTRLNHLDLTKATLLFPEYDLETDSEESDDF
mmetsp:Transcript_19479/g.25160  ORF Transcript_19479/g.25160 Transcript_19479/m.25160 type:complete len:845 (+) Transcript_19479:144-2678(+)